MLRDLHGSEVQEDLDSTKRRDVNTIDNTSTCNRHCGVVLKIHDTELVFNRGNLWDGCEDDDIGRAHGQERKCV